MTKILDHVIDIVAPSKAEMIKDPQDIVTIFSNLGIKINLPHNLSVSEADLICANTLEKRTKFLVDAINNPDSKLIWAVRGGYGAMELIPELEKYDFSGKNKILIGFSDMTALFLYFMKKYNWVCLHAPMLFNYLNGSISLDQNDPLHSLLTGKDQMLSYTLTPLNMAAQTTSSIHGQITGGNLTLIECSLGTTWTIDAKDKILFLEEIDEAPYRVRRSLVHLAQSGVLEKLKAVILGQMIFKEEDKNLGHTVIEEFFRNYNIPVYQTNDIGHDKPNYPLFLGTDVKINGRTNASLNFANYLYQR